LTAVFTFAAPSAVFNDRPRFSMVGTARADRIAVLYEREAQVVRRLVSRRANASDVVIEDACQTAWERLCAHTEVDVEAPAAVRWLVVTAMREAWLRSRVREIPVGGWHGDAIDERELPEPASDALGPLGLAIEHEHSDELRDRLRALTERERQFLALQAAGLSYREISVRTGATRRTVERQILRGRRKLEQGDGFDA
jgi:RNA polymerase sigma factor (sigma-70 family)